MNPLEQILNENDNCIVKEFTDLYEIKCPYGKDGQTSLTNDYQFDLQHFQFYLSLRNMTDAIKQDVLCLMLYLSLKELSITDYCMDCWFSCSMICWIVSSGNARDIYHFETATKIWYKHIVTLVWSTAKIRVFSLDTVRFFLNQNLD